MAGLQHLKKGPEGHEAAKSSWLEGAEAGHQGCQNALGGLALQRQEYDDARKFFGMAARAGHPRAALEMGRIALLSLGVEAPPDLDAAQRWLQVALAGDSEEVIAEAALVLGCLTAQGQGVPQDTAKAISLLERAAQANLPQAHYELGLLRSHQGPSSAALARTHYRAAGDLGHPHAQFNYGAMLSIGKGGEKDMEEAARYFYLAAQQKHPQALMALSDFCKHGKAGIAVDLGKAKEFYEEAMEAGYK